MSSDNNVAIGLLGVAIAVFGVSVSILGTAYIQAGGPNFNQYVILGVVASFVGVIVATVAVLRHRFA